MKQYQGIIIHTKQYEEKGILTTCLTSLNTVKTSLTKGIKSKQQIIQLGNLIKFDWFGKQDSLGIIDPKIEKSFNGILSLDKQACAILYCLTFLIYTLFKYDTTHKVNLYELMLNYFTYLSSKILKKSIIDKNINKDINEEFNYFVIEKIIIKNAGWLDVNNNALEEKDIKILFENLHIKNKEKFFFYRKILTSN
jgi:hypothetical protein